MFDTETIKRVSGPFNSVHTGEWHARNGACCVECGGFDCPGVYCVPCTYEPDGGFDRYGFNSGEGAQDIEPEVEFLFRGQAWLEKHGTGNYSFFIRKSDDGFEVTLSYGPAGMWVSGHEPIHTEDFYDSGDLWGGAIAKAHGMMMLHAGSALDR